MGSLLMVFILWDANSCGRSFALGMYQIDFNRNLIHKFSSLVTDETCLTQVIKTYVVINDKKNDR